MHVLVVGLKVRQLLSELEEADRRILLNVQRTADR